jgi:hypothetical protein
VGNPLINSIVLLVIGTGLTFLSTLFWTQRNAAVERAKGLAIEHEKLVARMGEVEAKLGLVTQQVIPFNALMQSILIKELTHYHTPELDALMLKIGPPSTLTDAEQARMTELLEERTRDMGPEISARERGAAAILPEVILRAKAELEQLKDAEAMKLKLVTVTAVVGVSGTDVDKDKDKDKDKE